MSHNRGARDLFGDVTGSDDTGSVLAGERGEEAELDFVGYNGVRRFSALVDTVDGYKAVQRRRCGGVLGTSFSDRAHSFS